MTVFRRFIGPVQKIIGYILLVLGSMFAFSALVGACLTLAGQLKTDSFWESIAFFAAFLIFTAIFIGMARIGWKLKCTRKKTALPEKIVSPQTQKPPQAEKPAVPQEKQCWHCKAVLPEEEMHQSLCRKCREQDEKKSQARKEMDAAYQAFLKNEGKLPQGFSVPYLRNNGRYSWQGTPFDAYLDHAEPHADSISNHSGISDWLHLDETEDINRSVAEILDWVRRHKEMQQQQRKMCDFGNTTILPPLYQHCTKGVMVILDDGELFREISQEQLDACKAAGISFCTNLTDRKLYDLMEQKEKGVGTESHPNHHDETHATWYFIDETSWQWRYL